MTEDNGLIDLAGIGEKYEEKGYLSRLGTMFAGLGKAHDTREYKEARIELQRLVAPLVALLAVSLFVIVLIVVTAVSGQVREEIDIKILPPDDEKTDIVEIPDDPQPDPEPKPMDEVEIVIDAPAVPMIDVVTPVEQQAEVASVKPAKIDAVALLQSPVQMKSVMGARTTGSIGRMTGGGNKYGDPSTEACVMKVLWWLKKHQNTDGSWSGGNNLANTALATLTYLAHGEYPGNRESAHTADFGPVVQQAVDYLINSTNLDGAKVTMRGADGNEYAFLMATYALCEAYGMTRNPNCKDVAYRCLDRIVRGQSPTGGWDYKINPQSTRDDMSFAGWALQALKAGKMAGLHPEGLDECIKKAIVCLQKRNFKNGGFNYTAGGNPTGLTATGCLAMQLLGYGNKPEVTQALDYMREWQPSFEPAGLAERSPGGSPQYYCYYATQCKYQAGMRQGATKADELAWQKWNLAMKKLYPASVIDDPEPVLDVKGKGHKQGHFVNRDAHTSRPVMDTCLAALQLMVYYRYLPTTQTKAGQVVADGGESAAVVVDRDGDVGVTVVF